MSGFWQKNMAILARRHPEVHRQLADMKPATLAVETVGEYCNLRLPAADGTWCWAYDPDDPWRGAGRHLATVPEDSRGLALCIGMGLGYGPLRLLRERPSLGMIVVVEPSLDLLATALCHVDLSDFLAADKVLLFAGEVDLAAFEKRVARIAALEDTHILRHLASYQWRETYRQLDGRLFMIVNQLNASGGTTRKCGEVFFRNRLENLALLGWSRPASALKDRFAGKPAVLVAAGPSLDRSMADLRRVAGRCVMLAVDSAVVPLLENGITPDLVTSIDYLDLNFEKFAPVVGRRHSFSLVTTPKVTPLIPRRVAARHHFIAFNDDIPQRWINQALGITDLVPPAFSVAHLSFGLALLMGCDPIILVGQDLGYTLDDADHAKGTVIMKAGLPKDREIYQVPAVGGGTVATDRGMMSLLKRFEDMVATAPVTCINATAAGARIDGTVEMDLGVAAARFMTAPLAVASSLDQAAEEAFPVERFVIAARNNAAKCRRLLGWVDEARRIAGEALARLTPLQRGETEPAAFGALPAPLQRLLSRFDQVNNDIDREGWLADHVLELTYGELSVNDSRREDNQRILAQGDYLGWLTAEIQRIDAVNQARRRALSLYADKVDGLAAFLDRERKLAADQGAGLVALTRLHGERQHYRVVEELAQRWRAAGGEGGEFWFAVGASRQAVFDYPGAEAAWAEVLARDADRAGDILACRRRERHLWLEMVAEHANFTEHGDNFPQLLPTWLERILALVDGAGLDARLYQIWEGHRDKAAAWLAAGDPAAALAVLGGWRSLADRLPGMDELVLEAALAVDDGDTALAALDRLAAQEAVPAQREELYVRLLLAGGRYEEGVARLQALTAAQPETATIWEEIGDILAASGDAAGAALAYERCFHAQPQRQDLLARIGRCYRESVAVVAAE